MTTASPLPAAIAPLPWEWFDFTTPISPLRGALPDVDHGGALRSYAAEFDRRPVPFKLLRRSSPTPRPTLALLHGMGLNIASFRGIAPYLLATHDLVLIDYTAFALAGSSAENSASPWPRGGISAKLMTESVWKVLDALELARVSLVGSSLGGGMCLIAALQQPARIEKLALANPACYPQELPFMYRVARVPLLGETFMTFSAAEKFVAGIAHIGYADPARFAPELRARYHHQMSLRASRFRLMDMIRHLPGNARDTAAALHLPRLGEITQPTLLLWGEKDPLLAPASGPRLARELPHCRFELFADLAHMPHEEAPERIGPLIAAFLNS